MFDLFASLTNSFQSPTADLIGLWVAAILTLIVFSYLLADTSLFRLAEHVFVGVAAGYGILMAWYSVLSPRFAAFLKEPSQNLAFAFWCLVGLLLFVQRVRSLSWFSRVPVAYLFGVGTALAIGGALAGSLLPQLGALTISISPRHLGGGESGLQLALYQVVLVIGALGVLLYFNFTTQKGAPLSGIWLRVARTWGVWGKWMILIAFGAIFAGMITSRMTLLISRLQFLAGDWLGLIR
jgi:hypothetical protein